MARLNAQYSLIEEANDRLLITAACRMVGINLPDFTATVLKVYCPFGDVTHFDGNASKAFRVYPASNSAFCFAGCGYFTPVRLIAVARDLAEVDAAQAILDETGYVAPDYFSRWQALTAAPAQIDADDLSEALKVACARMHPQWETRQFDDDIAATLSRCLGLLPKVTSPDDATQWLSVTKKVMAQALGADGV